MSTSKDQVEERKDGKIQSNVGFEYLKDDEGKVCVPSSPPNTKSSKEKMDIDIEKNNEGNVLVLVNRLSSKNIYAIITLTAQVGELISTNSWIGYHWIDNLPLNFIGYNFLYRICNELIMVSFHQKA